MQEDATPGPLLDDAALDALRRTRPWLYLLGILSCLGVGAGLIMLVAGALGMHVDSARSSYLVGGALGVLLIAVPTAVTQLGYAMALSRIEEARPDELSGAVERACVRQRNLWVVNAFTVGLLAVMTVLQLILGVLTL